MNSGQGDDFSRRAFLAKLSGLMAAAYGLQAQDLAGIAKGITPKGPGYVLSPWTGDDFTLGHRMRSGDGPRLPKQSDGKVDFVIVGGGNAGLTSAYRLRNENFILLEQYDDLGGTSRGYEENGLWYSIGAAYYSDVDGPVAQLVSTFGLKPAILAPDKNSFYFEGKWVTGVDGPDANVLFRNFKRLRNDIAPIIKQLDGGEATIPVTNPALLKLDQVNFASMLASYDPAFCQFVDRILLSSACADTKMTNALAGTILAYDFFDNSFVLPGGNPCLTRALAANVKGRNSGFAATQDGGQKNGSNKGHGENKGKGGSGKGGGGKSSGGKGGGHGNGQSTNHGESHHAAELDHRLKTGCFVWAVDIKDDGASVVYSDKNGSMHRVDCKHVILAAPPMVTGRIISGIKTQDKASLFWFRYGSYLVANMICKKRVFKGSYDNFLPPPFELSDITLAETPYLKNSSYKDSMGSVLTVYRPWMPGTMGRPVLEEGNRQKLAEELIKAISQFIPDLESNIDKIVMTRWGHAINVLKLRYYERISKINSSFGDSYTLSHSSLQGIQCLESAVQAGNLAADRALKIKAKGGKSARVTQTLPNLRSMTKNIAERIFCRVEFM